MILTIKAQRIEAGRAKQTEREAKLLSKRTRREAKATEQRRIETLKPFTKYSELQGTSNTELSDQLKYHKLVRKKTGFTATQANWTAYVLQLQSILSDWNPAANDLSDGDLGLERGKVERVRVQVERTTPHHTTHHTHHTTPHHTTHHTPTHFTPRARTHAGRA